MSQPSLLDSVRVTAPRRKRVRDVSRGTYRALVASGALAQREQLFLSCLEQFIDCSTLPYPTLAELTRFAFQSRRITREDPNIFRPRATELERNGVIEFLPRRQCAVTGRQAHPVRIAERR